MDSLPETCFLVNELDGGTLIVACRHCDAYDIIEMTGNSDYEQATTSFCWVHTFMSYCSRNVFHFPSFFSFYTLAGANGC